MAIVVIHGPKCTGKTFHAEALRKHYGCIRISDDYIDGASGPRPVRDGDLVLTTLTPRDLGKRGRGAFLVPPQLIPVHDARFAIGVGPVQPLSVWRAQ